MNVLGQHSRTRKLIACRPPEIETRLRIAREPRCGLWMCGEVAGEIATDLITARANARTNRSHDIGRGRAVVGRQRRNRHRHRTRSRAFPSGVNRCHGVRPAVRKQHRHAIGDSDAERNRGIVRDGNIGFRLRQRSAACHKHLRTVNLFHADKVVEPHPQRIGERLLWRDVPGAEVMRRNRSQRATA